MADVFDGDLLNGAAVDPATVTLTETVADPAGALTLNPDGTVDVAPGTPAGTYTLTYQICETLNPANCDTAVVTVPVSAAPIDAVAESFGPVSGIDGGTTGSILTSDTLNGSPVDPADVDLTVDAIVGPDNNPTTAISVNPDGTVTVPAGTPAGDYEVTYTICETLNPSNCDSVTETITVSAAPIDAVDDTVASPVNGITGATGVADVFDGDLLNGAAVDPATVTLTETVADPAGALTLNPDGTVDVAPGTPAGTYTLTYQICETLNPANCDTAVVTVPVSAAPIDAVAESFGPVSGIDGGTTGSILTSDTLNGSPVDPADVDLTVDAIVGPDNNPTTAISVNPDGTVTVPAGTPAGDYEVTYTICETLNPSNCDSVTETITVSAAPIDAVDDTVASPVNGITGATGVADVFDGDLLNGAAVDPATVTLTETVADPAGALTLNPDGTVDVAPGTPAGTYTLTYQICETLNPANCDTAVVTVPVSAAPIDAVAESFGPVSGIDGGTTGSILTSDTLNGSPVDPADVDLTVDAIVGPDNNPTTAISVNPDGTVTVPAGTPAGDYEVTYTICETLNPSNCDSVTETITVSAAPIDAVDDNFSDTVLDGNAGGVTPSVFDNDTLGDAPIDPTDVSLQITDTGGLTGVTINPDGTLTVPADTPAGSYTVTYEICETLNPANCDTATVTLGVATRATISGTVFTDENGDDALQAGEPRLPGVDVRIVDEDGTVVATSVTDEDGNYSVSGLMPGMYDVMFFDPETGTAVGGIREVEAEAGENIIDQNLPIDPSGVIYDAETGDPIEGATATLTDINGTPLPEVCFIDASQQDQVTGASGNYRFDIVPGADPACPVNETEYRLEVVLPGGVPTVFGFSPEPEALDATTCPIDAMPGGACQVFIDGNAPQPGTPSIFFTRFLLETGDPNVINNHVPVNLTASTQPLVATKTSATATAGVGAIVPYTITISNPQSVPVVGTDIIDDLPVGFRFVEDSSVVDGLDVAPLVQGNRLIWTDIDVPANGSVVINLAAVVGSGVSTGDFVNQAFAEAGLTGAPLSNVATATVRITPDDIFDCSEVIGKVFEDLDGDGYQDDGEPGLPGVRVATVKGLLITTDVYGRYHIACAATPREGIGSNFIVKLDARTLPDGYEVTTENPRVVRLTEGKLTNVDFGVSGARRIRVALTADAFVPGETALEPAWAAKLDELDEMLREQRSVLVLVYQGDEREGRLSAVADAIRERWADDPPYELKIEMEHRMPASGGSQ